MRTSARTPARSSAVPRPRTAPRTCCEPHGAHVAVVEDLELSRPVRDVVTASGARSAWLVVRVFAEPVGLVTVPLTAGRAAAADVLDAVLAGCGPVAVQRVRAAGGDVRDVVEGRGTTVPRTPPFLARHARTAVTGPDVTVVVCTRERPDDLRRALESLRAQSSRRFEVLVVDNAPAGTATRDVVADVAAGGAPGRGLRYVVEPRPGLSWARNHALRVVTTPVVAWLDDDETADVHWVAELAGAFADDPGAAAVAGCVVPAELRTQAQLWFEEYGGHTKGRGFAPDVFTATGPQHPMYPLPPFGAGANMAFAVEWLRAVGGFDVALGAGTATCGGEDTLAFSEVLLAGGRVLYRPTALTRHYHRPDHAALAAQMRGYGVGLTAYYAALVRRDPRRLGALLRLAPRALRDVTAPGGGAGRELPDDFPAALLRLKTRAMLLGPLAYVRALSRARALRRETT